MASFRFNLDVAGSPQMTDISGAAVPDHGVNIIVGGEVVETRQGPEAITPVVDAAPVVAPPIEFT